LLPTTQVGLVSQEPTLFANSIYENIAIGREGATREEVEAAARSANAWTFINAMPEKFDTKV
jgi:ATP-binding cassette subfamily B (MDR/TAP) protein 1